MCYQLTIVLKCYRYCRHHRNRVVEYYRLHSTSGPTLLIVSVFEDGGHFANFLFALLPFDSENKTLEKCPFNVESVSHFARSPPFTPLLFIRLFLSIQCAHITYNFQVVFKIEFAYHEEQKYRSIHTVR